MIKFKNLNDLKDKLELPESLDWILFCNKNTTSYLTKIEGFRLIDDYAYIAGHGYCGCYKGNCVYLTDKIPNKTIHWDLYTKIEELK